MASATFNEFMRELNKTDMDPQVKYFFAMLYERLGDVLKSNEETANVVLQMANSMQGFAELSEANSRRMQQLARGQNVDGVDVASVVNEPEKH
jgi:hypothetical protein